MANPKKIIITSKANLKAKYANKFGAIETLLKSLVAADKKKGLDSSIVYIDDTASAKKAGITAVTAVTRPSAKKAIDDIYKKQLPAYLVIFGSQDVIPFQELINSLYDPNDDDDKLIPSDLPYACDAPYSNKIASFTGPTRVLGRIPDITGTADVNYVKTIINTIISHKPLKQEKYLDYFSVTASVWKKSTQQSLSNIFGNSTALKDSPPATISYRASYLKPLVHFYNCHGAPTDSKFYGQKGNSYPVAMESTDLKSKITFGTIVAAECCYGAELYDPANEGNQELSTANTYFENKAIAYLGSSTIAYGPSEGQGLADLITQYFIINIINGASTGRAFLEARQKFLSVSMPLDPYEMKTLAQFYLLGDPSAQPVLETVSNSGADTVDNRRLNLSNKGINLSKTVAVSQKVGARKLQTKTTAITKVFKEAGFTGKEKEMLFKVKAKTKNDDATAKNITGSNALSFRTFVQSIKKTKKMNIFDVLVLKQSGNTLLGWKLYHRK